MFIGRRLFVNFKFDYSLAIVMIEDLINFVDEKNVL